MNQLGLVLVWAAIQVTIVAIVAAAAYWISGRRGPAFRAFVVLSAFALIVGVSTFSFSPWPNWFDWSAKFDATDRTAPAGSVVGAEPAIGDSDLPREPGATETQRPDSEQVSVAAAAVGAFWSELRSGQTVGTSRQTIWRWPAILAILFSTGVAVALARLATGVFAVRAYRRRSKPIHASSVRVRIDELKAKLSCRLSIEARESDELTAAATVGWRRPIVLLPADWRRWTDDQLAAVLAHEIAHIQHRDYAGWLIAQLGVALHFYHPLIHWLAGRLRLDQELAADSVAADLAGGRRTYLESMAELLLQQPASVPHWSARSFLPNRKTMMRRIDMLRDPKGILTSSVSGKLRAGIVAALVLAGVLAVGFRGSGGNMNESAYADPVPVAEQPTEATDGEASAEAPTSTPAADQPFSLAYVPRDAVMVAAIRPATLLGRPAMSPLADLTAKDKTVKDQLGITPAQMETVTYIFLPDTNEPTHPIPTLAAVLIRIADDTSSKRVLETFLTSPIQKGYGNQQYFQGQGARARMSRQFCFLPDDRSVVVSWNEGMLRRVIVAGQDGASKAAWAADWQSVVNDDAAIVANIAAMRPSINAMLRRGPPQLITQVGAFSPIWDNSSMIIAGARLRDQFELHARAECGDPESASQLHDTASAMVVLARNVLSKGRQTASERDGPDGPTILRFFDVADATLDNLKIEQRKNAVTVEVAVETAQLISATVPAVISARQAARRAMSANNLKQIALAFHMYHDKHKRFPPATVFGPYGQTVHSWRVAILPFLEAGHIYNRYRLDEPWDSQHNKALIKDMPAIFRSPNDDSDSTNSAYHVFTGAGTALSGFSRIRDISDGTSNTLLVVEAKRDIPWTKPEDIPFDPEKPLPRLGGFREGNFLAALCDGSVRLVMDTIDKKMLRLLIQRNDRKRIDLSVFHPPSGRSSRRSEVERRPWMKAPVD